MALIHDEKKEINAKIVYYGPGLSGKTTNIKFIYEKMKPEYRGSLKFLNTKSGKMLFFDFMRPDQIGIKDYDVRFHIYTVPGEVSDYAIWKTVLKGTDGLVFVADSEPYRLPDNLQSFEKLMEYLDTLGNEMKDIPCLLQCNKQDIPGAITPEEMKDVLHSIDCPMIPASAQKGEGVLNTLSTIVKMVLQKLRETPFDVEKEEKYGLETEEPVLPEQCEETYETPMEAVPAPDEEEVACEPPPEFISFNGFAPTATPQFTEDEAPEALTETAESGALTPEIDFAGEMEQVAPGHLRLPITIKCGQEMKRMSINLRISVETPEN